MSFLQMENRKYIITGVANKKSVAKLSADVLMHQGAQCVFTVQNTEQKLFVQKYYPESPVLICDVEDENQVNQLSIELNKWGPFDGLLHSIAFGQFDPKRAFHETKKEHFLQAFDISCFSLMALANACKDLFKQDASVVTVSISDLKATSYGYLGPIKAALQTSCAYLAKSFSAFSQVRFNAVCAGPLKTSASAGIPHYIENYLYAEAATMRKKALKTSEVANLITFLLSPASSGINATDLTIDAGMSSNMFDQDLVRSFNRD